MKKEQIRILLHLALRGQVGWETTEKWIDAIADAMSETDGDAVFESLRRRFSRKYGRRLGGCTGPLVAA